ncbi:MAG: ScyD/ScyE family protein [Ginsengibacter sp.]
MKAFQKNRIYNYAGWMAVCLALFFSFTGCVKGHEIPQLTVKVIASGLAGTMGIEADESGNILVTESGTDIPDSVGNTHNDNGKVIFISPAGKKYDAIINLSSFANVHSNELQGTTHLLMDGRILYILSGDYLYTADLTHYKLGDIPLDAKTLPREDVAAVISNIPSPNNPDKDSHPYNLTKGPDGDLYITDAGANAIVHRKSANNFTVLASFPALANPFFPGLGGPTVQAVPTSIRFDGNDFLVTILTGFPFPAGSANVYRVSLSGTVSLYQGGFTALVDQEQGYANSHIFVQHAASFNPATGFAPNSGSVIYANGSATKVLVGGLNQPVGVKQINSNTLYVTCLGDGTVLKVTNY